MTTKLILASKSPFRSALLKNAGIEFLAESADIDERSVEAPLYKSGATPEEVAQVLAEAKALSVSENNPDAVVIGCDQTLSLGDEIFHKPVDMEAARRQLLQFSGKTHQLNSGVVLVKNGETLWRHVSVARMTMRDLDPGFVGRYLGWRRCSFQCWRLSGRRSGHSAFRENRRRLFHHRRTAASAPA